MINPISQISLNSYYKNYPKRISFKEIQPAASGSDDFFSLEDDLKNQGKQKLSSQQKKFLTNYILSTILLSAMIGTGVYLYKKKFKNFSNGFASIKDYEFQSLKDNPKIPTLENGKSINNELKKILQYQVKLAKADRTVFEEAGSPEAANRLLLSGPPGIGKTFFSKVYAKTLDADYLEVLFSDLNSRWVGEVEEKMGTLFKNIIAQAKKNPDKKFVVTFNEIDSILLPVEQLTGGSGSTHFATLRRERSTFLTYIDKLQAEVPNVTVVGTTNLSPQNNNLDGATMSRFQKITEIPYPDKDSLYEAIKLNLEKIKGKDKFINDNDDKLKNLAQVMEQRKFSFRNLEYVINEAKSAFLADKINDKNVDFQFKYLENAQKSLQKTDGEREVSKKISK